MRFGVIGLGSIGERHVRNIQSMYPRATVDILTKRNSWSEASKNTRLVRDAKKFFAEAHDVYLVTNETAKHTETILRCLGQKPKGVFVEKPLAHTSRDIGRIRKALKKQKVVFFVAYCLQFSKPLLTVKRILDSGHIGTVRTMRVSAGSDLRSWRKGDFRKHYSSNAKQGGGVVLDLIHELNYPGWLLGKQIHFVVGYTDRISLPINAEDIAEGIFRTKKGVIISTHQDYIQTPGRRYCEVVGTAGTIVWDGSDTITVRKGAQTRTINVQEDRNVMYKKELAWFIDHVRQGKQSSNFKEAAHDVINADAIKRT